MNYRPALRLRASLITLLLAAGCVPQKAVKSGSTNPTASTSLLVNEEAKRLLVFIPVTDNDAVAALKLLERTPALKMVIALSPRFSRFSKEQPLKDLVVKLLGEKRLEMALQLPNAPLVPLLIDTNSAKDSLPLGSRLPDPPFAYPDDVTQIIARAKTDFFHVWKVLPHGIVLPYGAASPDALALFDKLGFSWAIAALGAPPTGTPYQTGSLLVWDATPSGTVKGTRVIVCDERSVGQSKTFQIFVQWAQAAGTETLALPSDPGITGQALPSTWARRTWTAPDWSSGIGTPAKNAAWDWLRKTREDLEVYKNSGRASMQRLDMAFEEVYTAENFNYFTSIGNERLSTVTTEDRVHEYQATLSTVYRLIGQNPPDDLFADMSDGSVAVPHLSSTTVSAEPLADGNVHLTFNDPSGDDRGDGKLPAPPTPGPSGSYDLRQFEVWTTTQSLIFSVTLGAGGAPTLIDIYMDLNNQPNLGTVTLLPNRGLTASPSDAWEYALSMAGTTASLYRTLTGGTYELLSTFPVITDGNKVKVLLPRSTIHGNPQNWGYQVLVMALDPASPADAPTPWASPNSKAPPVYDLLDPIEVPQTSLLTDIESGVRSDVPFVHIPH